MDEESDGPAAHFPAAREVGAGDRLMTANQGERNLAIDVPGGSPGGDMEAIGVYAAHLHQPGANLRLDPGENAAVGPAPARWPSGKEDGALRRYCPKRVQYIRARDIFVNLGAIPPFPPPIPTPTFNARSSSNHEYDQLHV
jgi:hypothetical protein